MTQVEMPLTSQSAEATLRERVLVETGETTIVDRFLAFHRANPRVMQLLERFADQQWAAGRMRLGMKALFERVRWELAVGTREDTGLKLNNNYTAYYARLLVMRRPQYAEAFTTRRLGHGREAQVL